MLRICRSSLPNLIHNLPPANNNQSIASLRTVQRAISLLCVRQQQQKPQATNAASNSSSSSLAAAAERSDVSTDVRPLGERIKENTRTASYLGVIVLGVAVTGGLVFAILRELWSSSSPNSVYSAALDRCVNDPRIQDACGTPLKGFGEETKRRRRTHVAHSVYERSGRRFMRMQFYVQGTRNKATVHLEMRENDAGTFEYRYLFAQTEHHPRTTIVLEDNRSALETADELQQQQLQSSVGTVVPSGLRL